MRTLGKPKLAVIFLSALVVVYGLVGGLLERVSAGDDAYGQLSIFTEVLRKIQEDYVETPDLRNALNGALLGMMEALDPFSSFVEAETYQQLLERSQMTASPGLTLSKRYGYAYVVAATPGSSAEAAGLRTGDLLESIDGEVTTRMSLWEANARLMGPENSTLRVRVVRARRSEPSEIELERRELPALEVTARIVEPGLGAVRIPGFGAGVAESLQAKLKMLKASGVEGLLVDLRGNAVGSFEEAVRAADLLLARGKKIVSLRDRAGNAVESVSLTDPELAATPLVVLVDGGASGPAEVFAAALLDNQAAQLVGEKTNGFGSEQQRFQLDDGSELWISTKIYIRPNGEPIQAVALRDSGLKPDVRSPSQEFVTNFYFENTSGNVEESLADEFYRKLDEAVERQQLESGLKALREKVLKKAA